MRRLRMTIIVISLVVLAGLSFLYADSMLPIGGSPEIPGPAPQASPPDTYTYRFL